MSIFKKRKQTESSDNVKVILKTAKKLSEEERNTIITIVKDGIRAGEDFGSIGVMIIMITGIRAPVVLNRTENGVEVVI